MGTIPPPSRCIASGARHNCKIVCPHDQFLRPVSSAGGDTRAWYEYPLEPGHGTQRGKKLTQNSPVPQSCDRGLGATKDSEHFVYHEGVVNLARAGDSARLPTSTDGRGRGAKALQKG